MNIRIVIISDCNYYSFTHMRSILPVQVDKKRLQKQTFSPSAIVCREKYNGEVSDSQGFHRFGRGDRMAALSGYVQAPRPWLLTALLCYQPSREFLRHDLDI